MAQIINHDKEYPAKCEEYMKYIDNHRKRVKTAYCMYFKDKVGIIFEEVFNESCTDLGLLVPQIEYQIENHDMSKYGDEEFEGYRAYFYPTALEVEKMNDDPEFKDLIQENFDQAWLHHQQNNDHHPQFWAWNKLEGSKWIILDQMKPKATLDDGIIDIPFNCVICMLCDWAAMSKGDNDFNYIPWMISDDSRDEIDLLTGDTRDIIVKITELILPGEYNKYKDQIEQKFYGDDNKEE
jgi:hypothetical protein